MYIEKYQLLNVLIKLRKRKLNACLKVNKQITYLLYSIMRLQYVIVSLW